MAERTFSRDDTTAVIGDYAGCELALVVEGSILVIELVGKVAPVVRSCAILAQRLVEASL